MSRTSDKKAALRANNKNNVQVLTSWRRNADCFI